VIEDPDIAAFQQSVSTVYDQYGDAFGDYLGRIRAQLGQ
jgi:hypothetical protein